MSILSREIARWIQSKPGAIWGRDEEELWNNAAKAFVLARRWKAALPFDQFQIHVNSLGYRTEPRKVHPDSGVTDAHILQFPEEHRGF